MADLKKRVQRLALSAEELRSIAPKWDDRLLEDYLSIIDDLNSITEQVDNDTEGLEELEQALNELESRFELLVDLVNEIDDKVDGLENSIKDFDQQIVVKHKNPSSLIKKDIVSVLKRIATRYSPPHKDSFFHPVLTTIKSFVTALVSRRNRWRGSWREGFVYLKNDEVIDSSFLMIANKKTTERAAPVPIGDLNYILDIYQLRTVDVQGLEALNGDVLYIGANVNFVEEQHLGLVLSGQLYEFSESVIITEVRAFVTELSATTNYRFIVADITDPDNIGFD